MILILWEKKPCDRINVFPVCTGMNRPMIRLSSLRKSVPRMHGDEPVSGLLQEAAEVCSPYARG